MDRSIRRLQDPIAAATSGSRERRRCVRQKLHTPVYASFNGPETGMVVDLSELLDLHEDGFAVQTSERLEMNRAVTVCLDLPETKNYIHGNGEVIWSDDAGRSGIRFSGLSENSRRILKEWLFSNLLIACSNQAARTEQLAHQQADNRHQAMPADLEAPKANNVVAITDRSVAAVVPEPVFREDSIADQSSLEEFREVQRLGGQVDGAIQFVTERAMTETGASGATLAFLTDDTMICRASAGAIAPPRGTQLSVKDGLSGECVRTGLLVSCEDMQNDARVDPAIGRELGIGSLMAAPIVSDFRVVGLLEIFSPHVNAFGLTHASVLQRLAEVVPLPPRIDSMEVSAARETAAAGTFHDDVALLTQDLMQEMSHDHELGARESVSSGTVGEIVPSQVAVSVSAQATDPVASEPSEPASPAAHRLVYRALLGLVIAVLIVVVGYVAGPTVVSEIRKVAGTSKSFPSRGEHSQSSAVASAGPANSHEVRSKSLAELRKVADQGDADGQWQMGVRYHNGEDVRQDDAEAIRWFQLAAEQGNVAAQSALGSYYWAGRGVPEDLSKAYFWSMIALAQGDDNSKGRLEGLASQMTQAQVSAARQQAEAWIRSHSETAKSSAN